MSSGFRRQATYSGGVPQRLCANRSETGIPRNSRGDGELIALLSARCVWLLGGSRRTTSARSSRSSSDQGGAHVRKRLLPSNTSTGWLRSARGAPGNCASWGERSFHEDFLESVAYLEQQSRSRTSPGARMRMRSTSQSCLTAYQAARCNSQGIAVRNTGREPIHTKGSGWSASLSPQQLRDSLVRHTVNEMTCFVDPASEVASRTSAGHYFQRLELHCSRQPPCNRPA